MKTNAIIRIILFSLAILVLVGILIGTFAPNTIFKGLDHIVETVTEKVSIDDVVQIAEFDIDQIQNINIDWVSGNIRIVGGATTDKILISESRADNEKYHMVCKQSGDTLNIEYSKQKNLIGINVPFSKELIITVPRGWRCRNIEISSADSDMYINDLHASEIELESASGNCTITSCNLYALDINTASGEIFFNGSLCELEVDAASADCIIKLSSAPLSIDAEMASGDFVLVLPSGSGFTCTNDNLSGNFTSDFPVHSNRNTHISGGGECIIDLEVVSGDVFIYTTEGYHNSSHHNDHHD